jgi:hypothetical protein
MDCGTRALTPERAEPRPTFNLPRFQKTNNINELLLLSVMKECRQAIDITHSFAPGSPISRIAYVSFQLV